MTFAAEDGADSCEVALPERRVLGEHRDLFARRLRREDRGRVHHVLPALPAGTERVSIEPRDAVVCRGARDVEHLVLGGDRTDLERGPRGRRAGEDLVPLADQILRGRDGLRRVGRVVDVRGLDRVAAALALRVLEAELEALDLLGAELRQQPGAGVDEADFHGLRSRSALRANPRRRGAREAGRDKRGHPKEERTARPASCHFNPPSRVAPKPNMRPDSGLLLHACSGVVKVSARRRGGLDGKPRRTLE